MTDIIARWRDAINDPPPKYKNVPVLDSLGELRLGHVYIADEVMTRWTCDAVQWLDVTTEPGIAISKMNEAISAREADIWQDIDDACYEIMEAHGTETEAGWGARAMRDQMRHLKPKEVQS